MANDLNQCNFIGRCGQDPEIRYTPSGTAVANFTLAVNEQYKDKSDKVIQFTEWVRVTAWARLAEIIGEYCHKGDRLFISGRMKTRSWEDRDGNKRYTTEIHADKMQMLDTKKQDTRQEEQIEIPDDSIPF